jgi:hypothetical protein
MHNVTIVDFIENALGVDAASVLATVETSPDRVLRKKGELLELFGQTWIGTDLATEEAKETPGELWPVMPVGESDVLEGAQLPRMRARVGAAHRAAHASRRDIQSLLLYAHGVHLPNPLRFREDHPSDLVFLRAVVRVCTLAPLISGGVVRTFEPPLRSGLDVGPDTADALDALAERMGLALMSYEDRQLEQSVLKDAALALLERAADRLATLTSQDTAAGTILLPTRFDRPATKALLQLLQVEAASSDRLQDDRLLRLENLVRLSLPGVGNLDPRQMVSIRSDDSFGIFRADMAAALREAAPDLDRGRLNAARRTLGEHMDAGLAHLGHTSRRGALAGSVLGDAVGWGIGAVLAASLAGLSGVIATLVGKGATDILRAWPKPGRSALRKHYVELGTASLNLSSDDINFSSFDFGVFWDDGSQAGERSARREAIVTDLLARLDGDAALD